MKKALLIASLLSSPLLLMPNFGCQQDESDLNGLPKKYTQYVQDSYQLYPNNDKIKNKDLVAYIKKYNPNRDEKKLLNTALAFWVDRAATCLDIDKRVLMSLIRKESTFVETAQSETNAVGLTQMTGQGIQEVNDQLGERGTDQAYAKATEYFNNAIEKCPIDGGPGRQQVWERATTTAKQKELMVNEPIVSILYGAVLLKTYLSAEKSLDTTLSMEDIYRNALRRYNGDPAVKEKYQKNILDSAAADFVTPP